MFSLLLPPQLTGKSFSADWPIPVGPRKQGQFSAKALDALRNATVMIEARTKTFVLVATLPVGRPASMRCIMIDCSGSLTPC